MIANPLRVHDRAGCQQCANVRNVIFLSVKKERKKKSQLNVGLREKQPLGSVSFFPPPFFFFWGGGYLFVGGCVVCMGLRVGVEGE